MSIAKITEVKAARKDQGECGKCGKPINRGDAYRHFTVGFRSSFKRVRCMEPGCYPRPSERESSKLADVYSVQEGTTDSIMAINLFSENTDEDYVEEIRGYIEDVVQVTRDTADEYREASTNDSGTVFNTDAEERADTLEGAADELENWEPSQSESGVEVSDTEERTDWLEDLKQEAIDAINEMELP